jgi:uncharacterized Zn finger protein
MTTDEKAREYLAEGRVRAERVDATAATAVFRVRGSGPAPYIVQYHHGLWQCTCPARIVACSHVKACSLVSAPLSPPTCAQGSQTPARAH